MTIEEIKIGDTIYFTESEALLIIKEVVVRNITFIKNAQGTRIDMINGQHVFFEVNEVNCYKTKQEAKDELLKKQQEFNQWHLDRINKL
tara:strand:+ start:159 stop:425 length:267 start_codon:yes stop_codon:yes gene_type:complete